MKNKIFDLFKGFLLGLDTSIPGFSIGTLAIILNIYERLINDLSEIINHPLKVIKKDWALGIGFIIGLVADIFLITFLLENVPFQTAMFFVGLVIMTIPSSYDNLKMSGKIKIGEIICFTVALAVLVFVTFLNEGNNREISLSFGFMMIMILIGATSSSMMILPGISGSLIILALGYYDLVISSLKKILESIAVFDFSNCKSELITILMFVIGVVIGLIGISKLLKVLFNKCPSKVNASILGLLVGSPLAIITLTVKDYAIDWSKPMLYISSIIVIICGVLFGIVLRKVENKNSKSEETFENKE